MLAARRRRPSPPPTKQELHVPAPAGGLNLIAPATAMPITDCLLLNNLVAAEEGLRVRLGWREWVTGMTGADVNEVRSVLPFTGSVGTTSKLFAATESGIWDCSNSSTSPTQVLAFPSQSARSGFGVSCVTVTAAGHFMLYADEENGAYIYTESTDTWAQANVTGVAAVNLVFCMVWKNRVWFVERDSARAWYLSTGAIAGAASVWNFGNKFRAGGHLVGLFNWTLDGGAGIDDSLVAISSGGDVVIYQGTDPDTAFMFNLSGVWFVGAVPLGRRIATNFGGDILILSSLGVLPLSKLVSGVNAFDPTRYLTHKIQPLIGSFMASARNARGWGMYIQPQDNTLIITVPAGYPDGSGNTIPTTQLAYSFSTQSWSYYGPVDVSSAGVATTRGLPIFSGEIWDGKFYFGTVDGRVCVNDEYVDGITLSSPNTSTDIQWSFLTGFSNLGVPRQKRIGMIRPAFLAGSDAPFYSFNARFNLDQSELSAVTAGAGGSGTWDTGIWDSAVWGAAQQGVMSIVGATGMGVHVAIAGRGTSRSKTILAGLDITYDVGGFL